MKKIMNAPERFVDDMLEGIVLAHPEYLKLSPANSRVLLNNRPVREGKVGIVTAGGSGHLPVFLGYIGENMLDGCAVGNVFASPSARAMAEMIRSCDYGSGVLCLLGNYSGDRLNINLACEEAAFDDIATRTVLVTDDVASSPAERAEKRRGVAGMVYAFKIAGAAAAAGLSLDEVAAVAQMTISNVRTMGVALSACVIPEVGKATFSIGEDEMEIGMGIHGEPGIDTSPMMTADSVADLILDKLTADMPLQRGDEVSVMVNGLGATPLEEQYILYRRLYQVLADQGISVYMPHIGEFATSMEMAGVSVSVLKLNSTLKEYLTAPAITPFYTNVNKQ